MVSAKVALECCIDKIQTVLGILFALESRRFGKGSCDELVGQIIIKYIVNRGSVQSESAVHSSNTLLEKAFSKTFATRVSAPAFKIRAVRAVFLTPFCALVLYDYACREN
jgi:hypothetical protein